MPDVVSWKNTEDTHHLIQRAIELLAAGEIVAFPTETVYGLAASVLVPEGVERLAHAKGRPEGKPMTLAIRGLKDALDWAPGLSVIGQRLARRCWPGPLTLVTPDGVAEGLVRELPDATRKHVSPAGTIGLRVPAHAAILQALFNMPGPIVFTSANRSGEPDATTADGVVQAVGSSVSLVIDDGPTKYGQPSTVVQVTGLTWKVLRPAALSEDAVKQNTACVIVFVCTGNTCRSPLAEALFKKALADRLQCRPEDLVECGFVVLSAGLSAMMGGGATPEAVHAAQAFGADLSQHCSQPLTADLVMQADYLIGMTRSHVLTMAAELQDYVVQPRLFCPDGRDVPDPIGGAEAVYQECAKQIWECAQALAIELCP